MSKFSFALCFGIFVFTQISEAASQEKRDQNIQKLQSYVGQYYVSELKSDTVIYHFLPRPTWYDSSQTSAALKGYVEQNTALYLDLNTSINNSTDANRMGLYTAQDPIASWTFGGDDWMLIAITLKKGARVLQTTGAELEREMFQNLDECYNYGQPFPLFDLFVRKKAAKRECLVVMNQITMNLKVDAIAYRWAADPSADTCRTGSRDAFIILGGSHLTEKEFAVFTKDVPDKDENPELRSILKAWNPDLWPNWKSTTPPDALWGWQKQHNYSCTGF